MNKLTKNLFVSLVMTVSVLLGALVLTKPVAVYACDLMPGIGGISFEILTPWYKYLDGEIVEITELDSSGNPSVVREDCRPTFDNDNIAITVTKVGVALVELMLRLGGFLALGFIVWGGIKYIISQGEPDGINSAKNTLTNAIIGLIITLLAIGITQFIGNVII